MSFTPLDKLEDLNIFPSDVHVADVENTTVTGMDARWLDKVIGLLNAVIIRPSFQRGWTLLRSESQIKKS